MLVTKGQTGIEETWFNEIIICLSGMAAVELKGVGPDMGSSGDISSAVRLAMQRVAYDCGEGIKYFRQEGAGVAYDGQDDLIMEKVYGILEKAYDEAKKILKEHEDALDALKTRLLEKDVLLCDEVNEICGF